MDIDDEHDLELAQALALSLAEEEQRQARNRASTKSNRRSKRQSDVVVISDDDDDDDDDDIVEISTPKPTTAKPKAPSRAPSAKPSMAPQPSTSSQQPPPMPPQAVGAGPLSFLADRAQLERERLARQKRLRPPSLRRELSPNPVVKRTILRVETVNGARTFPSGSLLRIDTKYATDPQTPSIRLSEVLGPKKDIALAILSSFVVDPVWLYSFFDPSTPVVLVTDANMCGAKGDGDGTGSGPLLKHMLPNWVRVCPRLHRTGGFEGCMHMKYMLLFSKTGSLRVVISSANLVPYDWRDIENYIYIQDFPPASTGATITHRPGEKPGETFPEVLSEVLRATGVEEGLAALRKDGHKTLPLMTLAPTTSSSSSKPHSALELGWDWRAASSNRVALVPSVSGKWEGWAGPTAVLKYGQTRLLRAVVMVSLCSIAWWAYFFASLSGTNTLKASSLGSYDAPWIAAFRLCAAGRPRALQTYLDRGRKRTPQQGPTHILYPTVESINLTTLGQRGGETLFCRPKQWKAIQDLGGIGGTGVSGLRMLDAKSRCGPVGMHTKMILGTLPKRVGALAVEDDSETESDTESETESDDDIEIVEAKPTPPPHAWMYVGSHNFTAAAWGKLGGSGFNPVLTISNYELGVVLPLATAADVDRSVAWGRPARPYIKGDEPWIQPMLRSGPM
ncbi:hypothetical protein MIND_01155500 [Mycena indigotica]|uniref:Phospholipase D/nuclease n=1 Tax=Mycena indigotica TaxID=2126181 RepID=A0A8H6S3M5_9AGAR|nr:uncharacterized protein MIND_01155500 [Mycena indigotica]KAF7292580.1 hypothetical protein MIND_01155500 [Mycena indigotica]